MKLSEIGERKIVEGLLKRFSIPFDDCAFIEINEHYLVLTTDMIYEKTHFPENSKPYDMGWYSVAVNLSDIASKGAEPVAMLVSFAIPRKMDKRFFDEIIDGMEDCINNYGGKIIGGDTKEGDKILISIAAIGKVSKEEAMFRKGAKVGDSVYITGEIGKGLFIFSNEKNKILHVKPRIREGRVLAKSKKVSCCMDISDGLASSLHQLMKINNVGFEIYEENLPVADVAKKINNGVKKAIYTGGDYELLFTIPDKYGKILERKIDIKKIGKVIEKKKVYLISKGKRREIKNIGYEHFK
ncbi:MAG: thiamine-phosphate kinase [Thermoplasmatales archaeon]|nr:thiamine-phosphate kinase [Thermoplasmatales archaeon]